MSNTRQANTSSRWRAPLLFLALAVLFVLEGTVRNAMFSGSWNTALGILNMGLISAITALGVNMQWGYAGLFNVGVVGFLALGGLAPVLVATAPVDGAWQAGGPRILLGLALGIGTLALAAQAWKRMARGRLRGLVRMGERRWDVVLDREQRILLPETQAVQALERVIALEGAQDVLARDVARVDMRLAQRPTVQMNKDATQELWRIRQISGQ